MNAPELTKLTIEDIDSLLAYNKKAGGGTVLPTLKSLNLITIDKGVWRITSQGKTRAKREQIIRDITSKPPEKRREEMEAVRQKEIDADRQARIESQARAALAAARKAAKNKYQ